MTPRPLFRPLLARTFAARTLAPVLALAACAVLGGCWPRLADDNAIRPPGADSVDVSPTVPSGAVLFTVVVGPEFAGEQVDLRVDGQRFYRANVTTPRGSEVTVRTRFAATPGLRRLFVRVGTIDYNVTADLPVRVGTQTCALVTFARNATIPAQSRIVLTTPETCP